MKGFDTPFVDGKIVGESGAPGGSKTPPKKSKGGKSMPPKMRGGK